MKTHNMEKSGKGSTAGLLFLKIIPAILLGWILLYTLAMAVSVSKEVRTWKSVTGEKRDSLRFSPEEQELVHQKTFLEARIALAGTDSIGITIDLGDSLVRLENKGVILREIEFSETEISRFFSSMEPAPYAAIFSKPFRITEIEGSIVKEPIQVKKAPRDTTEAALQTSTLDTSRVEFVEWHLQLDSSFVVSFIQNDGKSGNFNWPTMKYRFRRHFQTLLETNRALFRFRLPVYRPEITVFIPGNEAKSFYRALPKNGMVAIKF